jgi:hypothetical protein
MNNTSSIGCVLRLLVTARVVSSSSRLVTLMKEALSSSETAVLTRATRRNISEDTILQLPSGSQLVASRVVLSPAELVSLLDDVRSS